MFKEKIGCRRCEASCRVDVVVEQMKSVVERSSCRREERICLSAVRCRKEDVVEEEETVAEVNS